MDAIQLLLEDHRKVRSMFEDLEDAANSGEEALARHVLQILQEVGIHSENEETLAYPAFREAIHDTDLSMEAYEEHHVVKLLSRELLDMEPADPRFLPRVRVYEELVQHHIREEEGRMFPGVRKSCSPEELRRLGSALAERKKQLTRQGPRLLVTLSPESPLEVPR